MVEHTHDTRIADHRSLLKLGDMYVGVPYTMVFTLYIFENFYNKKWRKFGKSNGRVDRMEDGLERGDWKKCGSIYNGVSFQVILLKMDVTRIASLGPLLKIINRTNIKIQITRLVEARGREKDYCKPNSSSGVGKIYSFLLKLD